MPKKKIEETEVVEVEQATTEDAAEATEDAASAKSQIRIPFAIGMILAIGIALALIVTVFGDKAEMLTEQFTNDAVVEDASAVAESDVPVVTTSAEPVLPAGAPETTLTEQELAVEDTMAGSDVIADVATTNAGSSAWNTAAAPMPYALPPHVAQAYKDMQQQRRQAFERDMQRQQEMMNSMFEIRKTVFQQAEKRRQEAMARMQERQSEIEKQQMEMLQRRQQAFERSMQRT